MHPRSFRSRGTWNSWRVRCGLRWTKPGRTATEGKRADLMLGGGDRVAHIRNIRRVSLVMRDGVLFDPAAVYRTLGVGAPAPLPLVGLGRGPHAAEPQARC